MRWLGQGGEMIRSPDPHHGHRFPAEVIAHVVWLYNVFSLSLRDVELLLAKLGVTVSYESAVGVSSSGRSAPRRAAVSLRAVDQHGVWHHLRSFLTAASPNGATCCRGSRVNAFRISQQETCT
jgi:hypothetical protein